MLVSNVPDVELDAMSNMVMHLGYAFGVMALRLVFFDFLPWFMDTCSANRVWKGLNPDYRFKFSLQVAKTVMAVLLLTFTVPPLTYRFYAGLWGTVNTMPFWAMTCCRMLTFCVTSIYTVEVVMQKNAPLLQWVHHGIVALMIVFSFSGYGGIAPEFIQMMGCIAGFEAPTFGVMAWYYLTDSHYDKYRAMIFNHYFYISWAATCTPLMIWFVYAHWTVLPQATIILGIATIVLTIPMQVYAIYKFKLIAIAAKKEHDAYNSIQVARGGDLPPIRAAGAAAAAADVAPAPAVAPAATPTAASALEAGPQHEEGKEAEVVRGVPVRRRN